MSVPEMMSVSELLHPGHIFKPNSLSKIFPHFLQDIKNGTRSMISNALFRPVSAVITEKQNFKDSGTTPDDSPTLSLIDFTDLLCSRGKLHLFRASIVPQKGL
jgi:hypothetical protein